MNNRILNCFIAGTLAATLAVASPAVIPLELGAYVPASTGGVIVWQEKAGEAVNQEPELALADLVYHDCKSVEISAHVFDALRGPVLAFFKHRDLCGDSTPVIRTSG